MPIPEYVRSIRQHIGTDETFMPCTAACVAKARDAAADRIEAFFR